MSDHRSKSPPRVKISPGIDGLPPHRLLVSPGMEAELQRVSPHSMLLAQLTASEGLHRTPGAASPSSMMFSMGGVPMLGPQSAFTMARTALMGATLPPQTLFPAHSAGVPALVGSGLVSLPPGCPTGPMIRSPPRIHIPTDRDFPHGQYPQGPGTLRVPSPASRVRMQSPNYPAGTPDNGRLSSSPALSSRSVSPYVIQQLSSNGPVPRISPVTIQRVSPNPMHRVSQSPQSRVSHSPVNTRVLSSPAQRVSPGPSLPRTSPSSSHATIRSALHRNIPIVTIQRSSPTGAVRHPNPSGIHRAAAPSVNQVTNLHAAPQRISPLPRREMDNEEYGRAAHLHMVSPVHYRGPDLQPRASPGQQSRASPGQQPRASPVQQPRVSPGQQPRASPGQHPRASPGQQHRASPDQHTRASPLQHSMASLVQQHPEHSAPNQHLRVSPIQHSRVTLVQQARPSLVQQTRASPTEQHRAQQITFPVQHMAPSAAHRISPVPLRVSPVPNKTSLTQHRTSPGLQRSSPVHHTTHSQHTTPKQIHVAPKHRTSPIKHRTDLEQSGRMSPVMNRDYNRHSISPMPGNKAYHVQHRVSPAPHAMPHNLPAPPVLHNRLPFHGMPPQQNDLASVHVHGQQVNSTPHVANTSTVISVCKPVTYGHGPSQSQPPPHPHTDRLSSPSNPFAAAMTAAKVHSPPYAAPSEPAAPTPASLFNLLLSSKSQSADKPDKPAVRQLMNDIKQEQTDDSPRISKLPVGAVPHSSVVTPLHTKSYSVKVRDDHQHPVLSKQVTAPIGATQLSPDTKELPPLMPLLSNIMGLLPMSAMAMVQAQDAKLDHDSKLGVDAMPRLLPEAAMLANHISANKLLFSDQIKDEEEEESKWTSRENPFCLRLKNLNNFPSTTGNSYKPTYRSQGMAIHRAKTGCIMNTARSLDLLRHNLQRYINQEINQVIQKYIEEYFRPGVENMKQNNGGTSVSDDHMQAVCQQILEEAKKMYMTGSRCNTPDPNDNVSETGSLAPPENKTIRDKKLDLFKIKMKRRGSSDSEASVSKKPKRKGRPPFKLGNGRVTPLKQSKHDPVKKEGPKWDPDRLVQETQFVMGAKANKALGLGAQRGRLYIKHPELFKYGGDQEDKNWLHDNQHMPATGGKAYLLLVEDILTTAASDEYKDNPGLMLNEVVGFTVPDWMREKMKGQMQMLRTDVPKTTGKVKPNIQVAAAEDLEAIPFSSMKSSNLADKSDMQPSPSTTENMDVASTDQDMDDPPSVSPLNMTGGFTDIGRTPDVSPAPSADHDYEGMSHEPPLTAPFEMG